VAIDNFKYWEKEAKKVLKDEFKELSRKYFEVFNNEHDKSECSLYYILSRLCKSLKIDRNIIKIKKIKELLSCKHSFPFPYFLINSKEKI
jgi:hypothetical protein